MNRERTENGWRKNNDQHHLIADNRPYKWHQRHTQKLGLWLCVRECAMWAAYVKLCERTCSFFRVFRSIFSFFFFFISITKLTMQHWLDSIILCKITINVSPNMGIVDNWQKTACRIRELETKKKTIFRIPVENLRMKPISKRMKSQNTKNVHAFIQMNGMCDTRAHRMHARLRICAVNRKFMHAKRI